MGVLEITKTLHCKIKLIVTLILKEGEKYLIRGWKRKKLQLEQPE